MASEKFLTSQQTRVRAVPECAHVQLDGAKAAVRSIHWSQQPNDIQWSDDAEMLDRGPARSHARRAYLRLRDTERILLTVLPLLSDTQLASALEQDNDRTRDAPLSNPNATAHDLSFWDSFPLDTPHDIRRWELECRKPITAEQVATPTTRTEPSQHSDLPSRCSLQPPYEWPAGEGVHFPPTEDIGDPHEPQSPTQDGADIGQNETVLSWTSGLHTTRSHGDSWTTESAAGVLQSLASGGSFREQLGEDRPTVDQTASRTMDRPGSFEARSSQHGASEDDGECSDLFW